MPFIFEGATLGFFASLITALLCLLAFVGLTAINNYSPTFKTFVALFSEVRWPVIGVKYALMYVFAQLPLELLLEPFLTSLQ
jgi:cell division protein FtsX